MEKRRVKKGTEYEILTDDNAAELNEVVTDLIETIREGEPEKE